MMTGCPVVSTNAELSGTQDYVLDSRTGLVSKNDISSFINCIEWLIANSKMRRIMGKAAIKKIHELGDRKVNMQKLVDLFTELK